MSELTFLDAITPALDPGDYTITLTQGVSLDAEDRTATRTFQVAGERFALAPAAVRAVFPPAGSLGDHSNVLPHIVLDRATLPWEREPGCGGNRPWLVLLVFSGDEQPAPRTVPLGSLPSTALESHDDAGDPVTVIDVPRTVLADLMPPVTDLAYLAHVRRATDGDTAVVMAGRLPEAGASSTAHLVSVEGRYTATGFEPGPGDGPVRLVSLTSWTFACADPAQTFPHLARALADEGRPFRLPGSGDPDADTWLQQGQVPVRHRLRQGGTTVSWYRGPLVTGPLDEPVQPAARTSDHLLRYRPDTGMFDTGHAAAWQLGRLLMLQHTAAATALYGWKRRRAQLAKRADPLDHPLAVTGIDDTFPPSALALLADLVVLRGVPLRYLVPDERLLPVETVRFFALDRGWIAALLDGAYAIGRLNAADAAADTATPPPVTIPHATGALIRSDLISGYPDLLIDAYPGTTTDAPLPPLRVERLTPTIMLCLFDGTLNRLDLHQRPESLHFAIEPAAAGHITKTLRDATGAQGPTTPTLALGPRSTIPIATLAQLMAGTLSTPASGFNPAQFARQMLETAERVTFLSSP